MFINTGLIISAPEIFLLVMSCLILLFGVSSKLNIAKFSFYLAQITLVITAGLVMRDFVLNNYLTTYGFAHLFVLDKLAVTLKIFILISMIFTFWYSHLYNQNNAIPANEFYVLGLLATLGMMVLVSAANFITLFLGMELMSLPVYAMVALMRGKSRCIEAAIKYFVIGAVASGMFLYGLSLFFGATHSLDLATVAKGIATTPANQSLILYFGLVFVIAGIAFKLGAAPFHLWVPDVYDGAPNSVTLFISAAPKLAAFGLAIRFLVGAVPGLHVEWDHVLIAIGLLSIGIGNIVAVVQTNIKRLLAYSSIAQIGFMILGLACGTQRGEAAAFFYMTTYALTSLGVFGMIVLLSKTGFEANELSDFSGLYQRTPWLAFMMLLMMFSLAGIPPMVGFIAKVGILEALIKEHSVWLAVVAIIFAIIGAYYYIRVVKVMYFEDAHPSVPKIACSRNLTVAMTINGLAVLLLGIFPSQLYILCHSVF
ncbi:MAG: NADH-quinone oxidoreductase subunit N [Gammaproteobacteria bacterium RIFCSPHIGHO2_12_FULL_40_19]|nr:MAG: NADH-quinone oxidoreductase subunit N [Gammaproteobacteria bacterium RIFCSPHIGHO2_12_FULL_40_19]